MTAAARNGHAAPRQPAWLGMTLLSAAVALVSYRYIAQLGPIPPPVAANRYLHPWIAIHATAAATALLLGPLQFLPGLRQRRPALHRWSGRAYVALCLTGGVSALILATGVSSGPVARSGFFTLGLTWLATTATATAAAMTRNIQTHRRWMVRSFALTLSAVTLRLYLPLSILLGLDVLAAYRAIAWLCWVPNLLMAELYLNATAQHRPRLTPAPFPASAGTPPSPCGTPSPHPPR